MWLPSGNGFPLTCCGCGKMQKTQALARIWLLPVQPFPGLIKPGEQRAQATLWVCPDSTVAFRGASTEGVGQKFIRGALYIPPRKCPEPDNSHWDTFSPGLCLSCTVLQGPVHEHAPVWEGLGPCSARENSP
jgi:hypothetical protein